MSFAPPPSALSPRRRQPDMQPPALATSMSVLQRHLPHHLQTQTPASSTSLSSPFSGYQPSGAQFQSPQSYMSPATPHTAIQTNAPYNPQRWNGPAAAASAGSGSGSGMYAPYGVTVQAPPPAPGDQSPSDAAPPPPYSPRRPPGTHSTASPGDQLHQPNPIASPQSANAFNSSPSTASTAPSTASYSSAATSVTPSHTPTPPSDPASYEFPPPPPATGRRARSSSRSRPDTQPRQPLFSLSSLTSRSRHQPTQSYAESSQQAAARRPTIQSFGSGSSHADSPPPMPALEPRPPAARRAASTGTLGLHNSSTPPPRNRTLPDYDNSPSAGPSSSSAPGWAPGMPLPPPPPGPPPPSGSRSQSLNRPIGQSRSYAVPTAPAPPTRRPPASGATKSSLPPVPPTPADWVDEPVPSSSSQQQKDLHLDTSGTSVEINGNAQSNPVTLANIERDPESTGFRAARGRIERARTNAKESGKGIRERRTESRSGKGRAMEPMTAIEQTSNPWGDDGVIKPADLVLPSPSSGLSRRPAVGKSTPRSARGFNAGSRPGSATSANPPDSALTLTPRLDSAKSAVNGDSGFPLSAKSNGVLPSPTMARDGDIGGNGYPQSAGSRPGSSTLRDPLDNSSEARPARPPSLMVKDIKGLTVAEFTTLAIQRHKDFAEREANASSDKERVQIFADYIVAESRVRRERYASAIDAMGSEMMELTRDLFRPYSTSTRRSAVATPTSASDRDSSMGPSSRRGSFKSKQKEASKSDKGSESPASASSGTSNQGDSNWVGGYMPSLSPIMSMMSDAQDEESSRGRPASRWWEEGSVSAGGTRLLERTKREWKYMGVSKELRESLQYDLPDTPNTSHVMQNPAHAYGPNEYPPEKTGLHDSLPVQQPQLQPYSPSPFTPNPRQLDVSRLVTLPPPYPRHYPAVNNNHPDLTAVRAVVRSVSDFSDLENIKEKYSKDVDDKREEAEQKRKKRKSLMRADIQRQIEAGTMTYSEAGRVESSAEAEENEKQKTRMQAEFDQFQHEVVKPAHAILIERIEKTTASFEELRSNLFVDAQERNPNSTQEQGDEQPELLEKLTLLKWIYEAREQLHREIYDLLSQRNDKYKAMVILPYRLTGNEDKAKDAENFFTKDGADRKMTFEKETLKRIEDFLSVVEENVVRGVEVQLSAFWDIAPGLLAVCQKIPRDLDGFGIQIPAAEYEENPTYHQHPLQYLYSLLTHSEKSTYQFIEAQTNLLCLLHEVKSAVTAANCRLMESQRYMAGEAFAVVDAEMAAVRGDEERRLTEDLKEKVATVEDQWMEALGKDLGEVKERTEDWLHQEGGWEEDQER